jgi:acylphosphatase
LIFPFHFSVSFIFSPQSANGRFFYALTQFANPVAGTCEALRMVVFGDVQGVFFRAGTASEARRLGITGWVRNLPGGSVEVMAEGERPALEGLLRWCSHGPPGALVSEVKCEWLPAGGKFAGFSVRQ